MFYGRGHPAHYRNQPMKSSGVSDVGESDIYRIITDCQQMDVWRDQWMDRWMGGCAPTNGPDGWMNY